MTAPQDRQPATEAGKCAYLMAGDREWCINHVSRWPGDEPVCEYIVSGRRVGRGEGVSRRLVALTLFFLGLGIASIGPFGGPIGHLTWQFLGGVFVGMSVILIGRR